MIIPLIIAGTSAAATYWVTKDKPFPQELLKELGSEVLLTKYINLKEDPLTTGHTIILDTKNKCIYDLQGKTYLSVTDDDATHDEPVVAELVADANGNPAFKQPTLPGQKLNHLFNLSPSSFGWNDGDRIDVGNLRVQYKKPGKNENVVKWIETTVADYQKEKGDAVKRYLTQISNSRVETTKNLVTLSKAYDDLPDEEKKKYKAEASDPKIKTLVDSFFSFHALDPNTPASSELVNKARSPKLVGLSDEKKFYLFKQAIEENQISQTELAYCLGNSKDMETMGNVGIKFDSCIVNGELDEAKGQLTVLSEKNKKDKAHANAESFTVAKLTNYIKENPLMTVGIGFGVLFGGGLFLKLMGAPSWAGKLAGGAMGGALILAGAASYFHFYAPLDKVASLAGGQDLNELTKAATGTTDIGKVKPVISKDVQPAAKLDNETSIAQNDTQTAANLAVLNLVSSKASKSSTSKSATSTAGVSATDIDRTTEKGVSIA